jgi:hypothetical protein
MATDGPPDSASMVTRKSFPTAEAETGICGGSCSRIPEYDEHRGHFLYLLKYLTIPYRDCYVYTNLKPLTR